MSTVQDSLTHDEQLITKSTNRLQLDRLPQCHCQNHSPRSSLSCYHSTVTPVYSTASVVRIRKLCTY